MKKQSTTMRNATIAVISIVAIAIIALSYQQYLQSSSKNHIYIDFTDSLSFTYDVTQIEIDEGGATIINFNDSAQVATLEDIKLPPSTKIVEFNENAAIPPGSSISYQLSADSTYWYYFDGNGWVKITDPDCTACSTSAAVVNDNISTLPVTSTHLKLKTLFESSADNRPILRGLNIGIESKKDKLSSIYTSRYVDAPTKAALICPCEKGMIEITVEYIGPPENVTIQAWNDKKMTVMWGEYTNITTGDLLVFSVAGSGELKFKSSTYFLIVETGDSVNIHTSCSEDIFGNTYGNFKVISFVDYKNNYRCPETDNPPIAIDDEKTTPVNTPVDVDILANDSDPDGNLDSTSVTILTPPSNGLTNVDPVTGVTTYTPNTDYTGTDNFIYEVCDTTGLCDTATVTITIPASPTNVPICHRTNSAGSPYVYLEVDPSAVDGVGSNDHTLHVADATHAYSDIIPITDRDGDGDIDLDDCLVGLNNPPVAEDDSAQTLINNPVDIDILDNDSDPDNDLDPTSVTITSPPSDGTVTAVNPATGEVTYDPDTDFTGTDSFEYEVCDLTSLCDSATVTIDILPPGPIPPVANNDSGITAFETPITLDVPDNDTDIDGTIDRTTVTILTPPINGTITNIDPVTGEVEYTPNSGFLGDDTYTYEICDNDGLCDDAVVTITVYRRPVTRNAPPIARDDFENTQQNTTVNIDMLHNDSDPDGNLDPTAVTFLSSPTNGTVGTYDSATGSVDYTPNPGYVGQDTFDYEVCDTLGLCDSAVVTINIYGGGSGLPPIALDDSAITQVNIPVDIQILSNDSDPDGNLDPTSGVIINNPTNGNATYDPVTQLSTYTPRVGYTGIDKYDYRICDTTSLCDTATVDITITGPGFQPPTALDDNATTPVNTPINMNILFNDSDPDGVLMRHMGTITSPPSNGTAVYDLLLGTTLYTPNKDYTGTDTYDYRICDDDGLCDDAVVTITIGTVLLPPAAINDSGTTSVDTPVDIAILLNDSDPDGILVPTSVSITIPPPNGSVTFDPVSGLATYTPNAGYTGIDTFDYEVCDNDGLCDTATVTITIVFIPPPPPPLILPPVVLPPPPVVPIVTTAAITIDPCGEISASPDVSFTGAVTAPVGTVDYVEYSINGGASWNKIPTSGLETGTGTFTLSLFDLFAGDYRVLVRAMLTDETASLSPACPLTIAPDLIFGGNEFVLASQQAPLAINGVVQLVIGNPVTFFLEARGATEARVVALETGDVFQLEYDRAINLWTGPIAFDQTGTFTLEGQISNSVDNYSRIINTVSVSNVTGVVDASTGIPLTNVTITVYEKDDATGAFRIWNGSAYGQANPFSFDGNFAVTLPEGEFYLEVARDGYQTITSLITNLPVSGIASANIQMAPTGGLINTLASLVTTQGTPNNFPLNITPVPESSLLDIGEPAEDIIMRTDAGTASLFSQLDDVRPTVIFVYSAWNTFAQEQMAIFDSVSASLGDAVQMVPVATMEPDTVNETTNARGEYDIDVQKPTDQFFDDYMIISLPQFFVLDADQNLLGTVTGSQAQADLVGQIQSLITP